eukprot:TRINITY_DN95759_c0_g1_i1.p1 TRINITY_DN95759_c0_g1~~TRINITY_DN95759_c0_g1_i1.p1  ORF type:complete len:621 (-),score=77.40 TRINITY_DN95759_c0_g1_i1:99-1961(-)
MEESLEDTRKKLNDTVAMLDEIRRRRAGRQQTAELLEEEAMRRSMGLGTFDYDDPQTDLVLGGEASQFLDEPMDTTALEGPVGVRLYAVGTAMRERLEREVEYKRREKELWELSAMKTKPSITAKASKMPPRGAQLADSQMQWKLNVEAQLERSRQEKELEELAAIQPNFRANPKSIALLRYKADREPYVGPISGWESHFAKFTAQKNRQPEHDVFHPNINDVSHQLARGPHAYESLYDEARAKEERLRQRREQLEREKLLDPVTGAPLFHPNPEKYLLFEETASTASTNISRRSVDEVVHDLVTRGEQLRQHREKVAQATSSELTFRPSISLTSEALVARKPRKPLYQPPSPARATHPHLYFDVDEGSPPPYGEAGSECSLNTSSIDRTRLSQSQRDFALRSQRHLELREQKLRKMQQETQQKALAECTFAPKLCKQSEVLFEQIAVTPSDDVSAPLRYPTPEPVQSQRSRSQISAPISRRSRSAEPPMPTSARRASGTPSPATLGLQQYTPVRSESHWNMAAGEVMEAPPSYYDALSARASEMSTKPIETAPEPSTRAAGGTVRSVSPRPPPPPPSARSAGSDISARVEELDRCVASLEQQMETALQQWRNMDRSLAR